jgi:hypothetical protein
MNGIVANVSRADQGRTGLHGICKVPDEPTGFQNASALERGAGFVGRPET